MDNTIDLTPTWQGLLPGLLAVLERSVSDENWHETEMDRWREREHLDKSKAVIREELHRMAKAADLYNKMNKTQKGETT